MNSYGERKLCGCQAAPQTRLWSCKDFGPGQPYTEWNNPISVPVLAHMWEAKAAGSMKAENSIAAT